VYGFNLPSSIPTLITNDDVVDDDDDDDDDNGGDSGNDIDLCITSCTSTPIVIWFRKSSS
jgi:hypothetical protein